MYPLLPTCLKSFTFKVPVNHIYREQSDRHNLLHSDVASLPWHNWRPDGCGRGRRFWQTWEFWKLKKVLHWTMQMTSRRWVLLLNCGNHLFITLTSLQIISILLSSENKFINFTFWVRLEQQQNGYICYLFSFQT